MTFNAMTEYYEEITVCGKPALFTSIRIKRDPLSPNKDFGGSQDTNVGQVQWW